MDEEKTRINKNQQESTRIKENKAVYYVDFILLTQVIRPSTRKKKKTNEQNVKNNVHFIPILIFNLSLYKYRLVFRQEGKNIDLKK